MRHRVRILTTALALTAAACAGGGGGGGTGPVSPPPPGGSPPPSPPPPQSSFFENNSEYKRDYSKRLIHASAAYAAGATGQGVVIAVIDTGIDIDHAEFSGDKILPASIDVYGGAIPGFSLPPGVTRTFDDQDGHGTGVASAAAGNKLPADDPLLIAADADFNDDTWAGMHGVAFDSQLLVLRADDPGSCASVDNCSFDTAAIAAGIRYATDYAVQNDVIVIINMSLGGDTSTDANFLDAMQDAVASGHVILVSAAGNDGNNEVDSPANFAGAPSSLGRAVAVGAVGSTGNISSFSNKPGDKASVQNFFLVAPGDGLVVAFPVDLADPADCPHTGNTCYSIGAGGTSFASPQVAGALALLAQAFPNNTPEELVSILLESASDRGAAGTDATYGRGLLNLEAAFSPLGATSLNLGQGLDAVSVPLGALTAAPSGATGDWLTASGVLDGAVIRDSYRRPFHISPSPSPASSSLDAAFETAALGQRLEARRVGYAIGSTSFAYAAVRAPDDVYLVDPDLATDETLTPELSLSFRSGPLSFAMGRGFSAPAPVGGPSITTLTPSAYSGAIAALTGTGDWASAGYDWRSWSLDVRAASDEMRGFSAASLTRHFGPHEAGVEVGSAYEEEAALGGAAGSRLGGTDAAKTTFAALAWRGPIGGGWRGAARIEAAEASLDMPAFVHVEEEPIASSWSLALERPLTDGLDLGLTLAQPLRAESGQVSLTVPVGVTKTNASIYEDRIAALTPSGREIDVEAALRFGLGEGGEGRIAVRHAEEPAHVASADAEQAVWVGIRWTR